jgi:hypothetical protein
MLRSLFYAQDPEIILLQQRCYAQLTGNQKISDKHKTSVVSQLDELKKAAKGKVVLIVLVIIKRIWPTFEQSLLRMTFGISNSLIHSPALTTTTPPKCC